MQHPYIHPVPVHFLQTYRDVFTCPVDIRKDAGSKSAWLTSLNVKYSLEVNKRYKRKKILITVLLPAYHKPWKPPVVSQLRSSMQWAMHIIKDSTTKY
jgi:hypothetical protein